MDAVSSVAVASEVANSQVVWAIVAIVLIAFVIWSYNKRENTLMNNQKDLSTALSSQAETMKDIHNSISETNKSVQSLENRIEDIERRGYMNGKGGH